MRHGRAAICFFMPIGNRLASTASRRCPPYALRSSGGLARRKYSRRNDRKTAKVSRTDAQPQRLREAARTCLQRIAQGRPRKGRPSFSARRSTALQGLRATGAVAAIRRTTSPTPFHPPRATRFPPDRYRTSGRRERPAPYSVHRSRKRHRIAAR